GLVGERERARALMNDVVARNGPLAAVVLMTRVAVWWDDRELAAHAADLIEQAKAGASWDYAALAMRSIATRTMDPRIVPIMNDLTSHQVAARRRVSMHEMAADFFASLGQREEAMAHVTALARGPSTSLLWLDASPPLASVRGDPRFSEARAIVAARCADLWGAVGSWPSE